MGRVLLAFFSESTIAPSFADRRSKKGISTLIDSPSLVPLHI